MEISITCPKCGATMSVPLAEMGEGEARHCPGCGAVIRFRSREGSGIDGRMLEQAVEQLEHAGAHVTVRVNRTTKGGGAAAPDVTIGAPIASGPLAGAPARRRRSRGVWTFPLVVGLLVLGFGIVLWRGFRPAPPLASLDRARGVLLQAGRPTSPSSYSLWIATAAVPRMRVYDRIGCHAVLPADALTPGDSLEVWYSPRTQVLYQLAWHGAVRCGYDAMAAAQLRRIASAQSVGKGLALTGMLLLAIGVIGVGRTVGEG